MAYMEKRYQRKITLGQSGNSLTMLIAISLVMYVALIFLRAVWHARFDNDVAVSKFYHDVASWFYLSTDFNRILSRPWTIITQMFVHLDVWAVFSDMLWLWSFGFIMQDLTGNRKIVPIFIYGSIVASIAFVAMFHILPAYQSLIPNGFTMGASAGVMSVAIATTLVAPNYRIFPMIAGGIPLWVLTALYVLIDIGSIGIYNIPNLAAHVSAGLFAYLFMFFLRKGYDWSEWMNNFFDWISNLFNPDRPKKGRLPVKEELFYKSSSRPFKKTPNLTQQRIDDILDKINQKGYHFLTDEEKELLRRASQEDL